MPKQRKLRRQKKRFLHDKKKVHAPLKKTRQDECWTSAASINLPSYESYLDKFLKKGKNFKSDDNFHVTILTKI